LLQLSFPFNSSKKFNGYQEEDFILSEENISAFKIVENFFAQKNFNQSNHQSLILKGQKSSGKTHLLTIFTEKFNADFIDHTKITGININSLFKENCFFICENIDEIEEEENLLHLINSAVEESSFLLLTGNLERKFTLKDLNSRLNNILKTEIFPPNQETIKRLLVKELSTKQIKISYNLIKFISQNLTRKYQAIIDIAKIIEANYSLNGKPIGMDEIKKIVKQL
jgi:chromosomal replication initiation ATPase DnaA